MQTLGNAVRPIGGEEADLLVGLEEGIPMRGESTRWSIDRIGMHREKRDGGMIDDMVAAVWITAPDMISLNAATSACEKG